jgi:hypothetical protein
MYSIATVQKVAIGICVSSGDSLLTHSHYVQARERLGIIQRSQKMDVLKLESMAAKTRKSKQPRRFEGLELARLRADASAGMSVRQLAKKYGCSIKCAYHASAKLGAYSVGGTSNGSGAA